MTDKLAVVTGASSGLGYQFARLAAQDGYDLVLVADEDEVHVAADKLRRLGANVEAIVADLSTRSGVAEFWTFIEDRRIDFFAANAGRALGEAFHDQNWSDVKRLIDLNILQTTSLLYKVGQKMHADGEGRILVTGSIGGFVPGPFDAVYDATKAYLNSLCYALQDEWKDSDVTLTCLMPGPTETPIFHRSENELEEAPISEADKQDPVKVAEQGYAAAMRGDMRAIPGFFSKVITMFSGVVPDSVLAKMHRQGAEPSKE